MTENIATLYINELAELYNVSDKNREKMYDGAEQINKSLGQYYWDDIKHALQKFYTYHNDKSRPRLAQIIALLESNPNITKREPEPQAITEPELMLDMPTTNIYTIKGTFNRIVDVLIRGGVLPNEHGKYANTNPILHDDGSVVLNPMQWLRWQVDDAKATRPDLFAPFPNATILEQIAIGVQNKLITFKILNYKGGNK